MTDRLRILGFATALGLTAIFAARAQQSPPPQSTDQQPPTQSSFSLKVNSDIVLTNVVVRDKKTGAVVRGLTAKDFTILENGKQQQISSFDFESVDQVAPLNEATINGQAGTSIFNAKNGLCHKWPLQRNCFWRSPIIKPM